MSRQSQITVSFEMANDKTLEVVYLVSYHPGNYWTPPEVDVSDGEIYIEGEEVNFENLPKGLDKIVEEMYEADASTKKFGFKDESYEPDYDYF